MSRRPEAWTLVPCPVCGVPARTRCVDEEADARARFTHPERTTAAYRDIPGRRAEDMDFSRVNAAGVRVLNSEEG